MKILVTGAAGFIGSAVTQQLLNDGHEVIAIDNFNEYYDPVLKRDRAALFLTGATLVTGDITDAECMEQVFTTHSIDVVCHLAAQAGVRYSVTSPEMYVRVNVLGTQILLETMQRHQVKRLVFASTSSAYGVSTAAPFQEHESADRPVSVYSATKRAGELLAHSYHQQYGIQVTCLRFFTVYGPWSRPDMAMLKFAQLMQRGEPIDIYNEGKLRRDFTYINDIVAGFIAAIEQPLNYEIINLGNGSPIELMTFVELLQKALGVKAEINFLPMQQGDVFETYADTSKAERLLNFKAKTSFQDGVDSFADWFKTYYKT